MSLIFVIGLFGIITVLFLKKPIIGMLQENNRMLQMLGRAKWYQNHWFAGAFLFGMNAALFGLTILILLLLSYFIIPFVHLLVLFFAVWGSIMLWVIINKSWQGTKPNRLKLATVGSSFYVLANLSFVYWLVTLEPAYPGEDTFMRSIGLVLAIVVTAVAFIACFIFTGFTKNLGSVKR
ncbi:hypothetical protein [Neobacillus sp. Marseille-QA0830]